MAASRRISLAIFVACSMLAAALTLGISWIDRGLAVSPAAATPGPAASPSAASAPASPFAPGAASSNATASAAAAAAVDAFRRGDLDEATRWFHRAGRDAMLDALGGGGTGDRTAALAAMWAMQERGEPWPLAALAVAAGSADRRRALAASTAAVTLASRLELERAEAEDLDGEALLAWQADWLAVARRAEGWIDVRSDALEVAALLGRAATQLGAAPGEDGLLAATSDPDPALRRAAIELLSTPLPPPVRAELARLTVAEAEPEVARAAAAALCAELAGQIAGDVLGALGREGLTRVRELAKATTVALAADVDLARCLAADGRPESRAALRALVAAARGPLRKALASVERGAR